MKSTAICTMFLLCTGSSLSATTRPNVLLFIADDMSQDAGCYGNRDVKRPNLDTLAMEAALFPYAYCTTASCSPNRAVIMTGLHSHANGQYGLANGEHNFATREGVATLPVLMREAGYRTVRVGRTVHVRPPEQYELDLTLPPIDAPFTLEKRHYGRDVVRCAQDAAEFIGSVGDDPFFLMFCTNAARCFGTAFEGQLGKPNTFANDRSYEGVEEVTHRPDELTFPPFLPARAELAENYQCVSRRMRQGHRNPGFVDRRLCSRKRHPVVGDEQKQCVIPSP